MLNYDRMMPRALDTHDNAQRFVRAVTRIPTPLLATMPTVQQAAADTLAQPQVGFQIGHSGLCPFAQHNTSLLQGCGTGGLQTTQLS